MPREVSREKLFAMIGREAGPSRWVEIDQARVDLFAEATGDHQYIHVDPERAAETPFGGTIAHGFLSLSLISELAAEISVVPKGTKMAINYGLNKVRFPQPVKVPGRVRLRSKITNVRARGKRRIVVTGRATLEIEGEKRPAVVAETLSMFELE